MEQFNVVFAGIEGMNVEHRKFNIEHRMVNKPLYRRSFSFKRKLPAADRMARSGIAKGIRAFVAERTKGGREHAHARRQGKQSHTG